MYEIATRFKRFGLISGQDFRGQISESMETKFGHTKRVSRTGAYQTRI